MMQSQGIPISLDRICPDSGIPSREEEHPSIIQRFAQVMRDGADYPSIMCFFDGEDYKLIYGLNLLKAAREAGLDSILVDMHPKPSKYYNKPIVKDKMVRKMLLLLDLMGDEEKENWPNQAIAEVCGVDEGTVRNKIKEYDYKPSSKIRISSKNGNKSKPYNTSNIGSKTKRKGFDWAAIDEKQFEDLVYEIVKVHAPAKIQSRTGTGGQGRDLEAKFISKDSLGEYREEIYLIEAKHHQSGVPPEHISGALAWAQAEQPSALVIAVSNCLTNPCKNSLIPSWRKNNPKVRLILWERKNIEEFVKSQASTRKLALDLNLISKSTFRQLTQNLSKQVLEEYQNLFIDFLEKIQKVFGISVDKNEVRSKLLDYGFSDLIHHYNGKSCEDPEVASIMIKAFSEFLNDVQRDRLLP